jgi:hypothetical protein
MTNPKKASSVFVAMGALLLALTAGCEVGDESIRACHPDECRAAGAEHRSPGPNGTANGTACTAASECASGHCVDGVCCEQSCDGTCFSCNQPGSAGQCTKLDGAEDHAAAKTCEGSRTCTAPGTAAPICATKDGEDCTTDSECYTGICLTMYFDGDHDGWGTGATRRCGRAPLPGYTLVGRDCCDRDPSVFPGSGVLSSARNTCGTLDWNCDGGPE